MTTPNENIWHLESEKIAISIDQNSGMIKSLIFRDKNIDLFQQLCGTIESYAGGIKVYDELDKCYYSDITTPCTISDPKLIGATLSYTKQYNNAPFALQIEMALDKDWLQWKVDATKLSSDIQDRSLRVHFLTPLIAGWDIWAPCNNGQRTFDGMTPFEHCYLQIPYVSESEVILPMFSHFNQGLNIGYSMIEPIDAKVPAAKFGFNNIDKSFTWTANRSLENVPALETVNYFIGLVDDRSMHTELFMHFHEGDWRPALGAVFERWKPFFVPKNDRMYEMEGMFTGGDMHGSQRDLDLLATTNGKYNEIHGHFSYYSDYLQEGKERWLDLFHYEQVFEKFGRKKNAWEVRDWVESHTALEIYTHVHGSAPEGMTEAEAEDAIYITHEFCHQYIKGLKERGIHGFWYTNYTDGFRPVVEENWPDAISRNEDGSYQPSGWRMCHNMNSDPKYSFGKHLIDNAKKIIETYPDLDGFFLDCFRHFEVDFAHDDGITVVNNRPAYSINFSYDDIEKTIEQMLLDNDMCTFANKPQTIRQMRYVDGMMIEGDGDMAEMKFYWSCIAKPIIYLWTSDKNSDENNCRRSVIFGCFPQSDYDAVTNPENSDSVVTDRKIARRKEYEPLYKQFSRRVFCFEADPFRIPRGCRAELYTVGNDYVCGLANLNIDDDMEVSYSKTQYAIFRVKRGHDITKVTITTPGDKKPRDVTFKFNGTFIAVPLEGFTVAAVIKLHVTENTGKTIGNEQFSGSIESCGDPDSAFENLSEL